MRDFDPSESMENVGILDVFPIFHTARLGQKIRRSPQLPLCGVALGVEISEPFFLHRRRRYHHSTLYTPRTQNGYKIFPAFLYLFPEI